MPVNLLPVIIPLLCIWAACAWMLFRWRAWGGWCFVGLTIGAGAIRSSNTGVEQWHDDFMRFEEATDYGTIIVTTGSGTRVELRSPALARRLRGREGSRVHVVWRGTYDFGRLRAYHFQTIDGFVP